MDYRSSPPPCLSPLFQHIIKKSSLDQLHTTWYNRGKGCEPIDQQLKNRRLSAVKAADAINAIEGILCV